MRTPRSILDKHPEQNLSISARRMKQTLNSPPYVDATEHISRPLYAHLEH